MKLAKWNEKIVKAIEQNDRHMKYYQNDAACAYAGNEYVAYKINGRILSVNPAKFNVVNYARFFTDEATRGGIIVKRITRGKSLKHRANALKLENGAGVTCYVQERFTRMFPKNVDYYITAHNKPIYASIWENGKCNIIGLVMPYLGSEEDFMAQEE